MRRFCKHLCNNYKTEFGKPDILISYLLAILKIRSNQKQFENFPEFELTEINLE